MHFFSFLRQRSAFIGSLVLATALSGCGVDPSLLGGPDTLPSTIVGPIADDFQVTASQDADTGEWKFAVQEKRPGSGSSQLSWIWDFGDGQTHTGTAQTISFPEPGLYTINVKAYDSRGREAFLLTLDLEIPAFNEPPIVVAQSQTVEENTLVFLDGSATTDLTGDELTYTWRQVSGVPVLLKYSTLPIASFVAPLVEMDTRLVFALTVSDAAHSSQTTVTVDVLDVSSLTAGGDPTCRFSVTLDGLSSTGDITGHRPLTVVCSASITGLDASVGADLLWSFDGITERGTLDTITRPVFNTGGIHAIALSLVVAGVPLACQSSEDLQHQASATVFPMISGKVVDETQQPVPDVDLGGSPSPTATNAQGDYLIEVPFDWSGVVTPQHADFVFSPTEEVFEGVQSDLSSRDLIALTDPTPTQVPCNSDEYCDDGVYCNGYESCVSGFCEDGPLPCISIDTCDEELDRCHVCSLDGDCSDGVYCNGVETCLNPLCQPGVPVDCNDGVECTVDSCNEATDSCDNTPNNSFCDDGMFCSGEEICNATLGCQAGVAPCAGPDCDEAADICLDIPILTIQASAASGQAPLEIEFHALEGGNSPTTLPTGSTLNWGFGDGSPMASGNQVFHTFTSGGSFTVVLTLALAGTTSIHCDQQTINMTGAPGQVTTPAIAVWAYPDGNTVVDTVHIGAVSYHSTGMARVDFNVDGGPVTSVTQETINPDTNEYEFVYNLDTTTLSNGSHTVRAVAVPRAGVSTTMPDLLIQVANGVIFNTWYTDSINGSDTTGDGTLASPYATIHRAAQAASSGDTIRCQSGNYQVPGANNYGFTQYVTIMPDNGATVVIDHANGDHGILRSSFLKFVGLTFSKANTPDPRYANVSWSSYTNPRHHYWFKNCQIIGRGRNIIGDPVTGDGKNLEQGISGHHLFQHVVIEQCEFREMCQAIALVADTDVFSVTSPARAIVRQNNIHDCIFDAVKFSSQFLITNNDIHDLGVPPGWVGAAKMDFYQCDDEFADVIIRNNRAYDSAGQGYNLGPAHDGVDHTISNVAIVNNLSHIYDNGLTMFRLEGYHEPSGAQTYYDNILVEFNTMWGGMSNRVFLIDEDAALANFVARNNIIGPTSAAREYSVFEQDIDYNCHNAAPHTGTHSLLADPGFRSITDRDFRLSTNGLSPCVRAGTGLGRIAYDINWSLRPLVTPDIGAYQNP